MSAPTFAPVDEPTADLLTLIATDPVGPWADEQWRDYTRALEVAADPSTGRIDQTRLRELLRDQGIAPKRVGAHQPRTVARAHRLGRRVGGLHRQART